MNSKIIFHALQAESFKHNWKFTSKICKQITGKDKICFWLATEHTGPEIRANTNFLMHFTETIIGYKE